MVQQCPAKFARKDRLSRHFLIHGEGERLKCPFHTHFKCSREFTRRGRFVFTITEVRKIKFNFNKAPTQRSFFLDKLKAHVMSHTEHASSGCTFCKKQLLKFSVKKGFPLASDDDVCNQSFTLLWFVQAVVFYT